jgi:hypothetical protein
VHTNYVDREVFDKENGSFGQVGNAVMENCRTTTIDYSNAI